MWHMERHKSCPKASSDTTKTKLVRSRPEAYPGLLGKGRHSQSAETNAYSECILGPNVEKGLCWMYKECIFIAS